MSRSVRLDPAAVAPGGMEQMMVRLEEPGVISSVQLDDPESFEVVRVIAGPARSEGPFEGMKLPIFPPNAFVIVLVRGRTEETKVCGGALILDGEGEVKVSAPAHVPTTPTAQPKVPEAVASGGTKEFKVDARGWPQGGMNEVWVLMQRGEAERMVQAINGYPVTPAERPALLRRFHQALGLVK